MSVNIFVDTNIFVYAQVSGESVKHAVACDLLEKRLLGESVFVSTQVLGEVYSALCKHKRTHADISRLLEKIIQDSNVSVVTLATVRSGLEIVGKYGYSYWDSLLLAAALESHCEIMYSEDMQHNQVIENRLKILNPFIY